MKDKKNKNVCQMFEETNLDELKAYIAERLVVKTDFLVGYNPEVGSIWKENKPDKKLPINVSTEELKRTIRQKKVADFADSLMQAVEKQKLNYPEVYNPAGIDRRTFQKIITKKSLPKKDTAIALGLALHLSYSEFQDFIGKADHHLSNANVKDITIEWCIKKGIYKVRTVNKYIREMEELFVS